MKAKRAYNPFLIFLVVFLTSYHVYNFFDKTSLRYFWGRKKVSLQVKVAAKPKEDVTFTRFHLPLGYFDPASTALSELGRTAKFFLNEIPSEHLRLQEGGRERLYFRHVFNCLGSECVNGIKQRHLPEAKKFVDWSTAHGAIPVLLVVPKKALVDYWGEKHAPSPSVYVKTHTVIKPPFAASYQALIDAFPAETPNLLSVFVEHKLKQEKEALYFPYDHHWTPQAMVLTVEAVKQNLRLRGVNVPNSWVIEEPNKVKNFYSVFQIFNLGLARNLLPYFPSFQFEFANFRFKSEKFVGGRVIVFGTSFSEMYRRLNGGLASLLGEALGRKAMDYSVGGGGLDGGFLLWEEREKKLQPGDIVVWEVPGHIVGGVSRWQPLKAAPLLRQISNSAE